MKANLKVFSLMLTLCLCFVMTALGQETKGELQGTVKDQQGAVVPGATVNIRGVDVGFNRQVQTDDQGFFRARELPPGLYNVTVDATSGFEKQVRENVRVTLGNATTVDIDLSISGGQTVVDVTSDVTIVDPTETKAQENITQQDIENLPKGTTFSSLLRTTASTRAEPLSGQFSINGGSGAENSFIVDGQEVSNFRTGALNSNNDLPYQFVQEVQVKSSGFEAEFGGATGGVVSVVTKSGTNQFRGEFGSQFGISKFNAGPRPVLANVLTNSLASPANGSAQFVTVFPQNKDPQTNFFPVGSIGGPIIKDKLWFYGIYAPQYLTAERTTNFVVYNTAQNRLVPVADANLIVPLRGRGISPTQTARAKTINEYAFIKLDASPSNTVRLSSSFTYNPIINEGLFLGGTTVVGTQSYVQTGGNNFLVGSDLANLQGGRQNANNFRVEGVWTPNSNLVALVRYSRGFLNEKLGSYYVPNIQRIQCAAVPAAFSGAAGCVQGFQNTNNNNTINKDVSVRNTVDADLSYLVGSFGGRHEFKGGYQFNRISNDVDRGYDRTGRIALYYGRTNFDGLLCFGSFGTPGTAGTISARPGARGVGCLLRIGTLGEAQNRNQALYIQDKWQPFNRLTLNLGVRTEKEDLPAFNGQTTGLAFSFGDKFAPRLGASYALTGDGKTKIAAFYGWFYDRLKFELPRGSFGGDFYRVDFFEIPATGDISFNSFPVSRIIGGFGDPIGGGCPPGGLNGAYLTLCQLDYRIPSNVPNLTLSNGAPVQAGAVDPNLKPFRQSEFTVEFQREVMRSSIFTARYIYRNVDNAVEDAGFVTPEGSEFYIIANPGEGLHAQRARDLGFQRLVTPQRRYDAFQAEYDTRLIRDLSLNVNYTYSRLYGNYSGLASSDEGGRLSPGVNRFFDLPFVGFTASGQPDNGRLATDRPHVFKASGTYNYNWLNKDVNTTALTLFTTVQSGTPQTTFVDIFGIPIIKTARGDLGRTEMFTQTDFSLTHRYRFGRDNRFAVAVDVNVLNLFNEANVLLLDGNESSGYYLLDTSEVAPNSPSSTQFRDAVNILTSRGVINELNASTAANGAFAINQTYRQPTTYQGPRSVRFGFRFIF